MDIQTKILTAGLTLQQVIIVFAESITATKQISGQGTEITFNDGAEVIFCDSGNYLDVYSKQDDIYTIYELQSSGWNKI